MIYFSIYLGMTIGPFYCSAQLGHQSLLGVLMRTSQLANAKFRQAVMQRATGNTTSGGESWVFNQHLRGSIPSFCLLIYIYIYIYILIYLIPFWRLNPQSLAIQSPVSVESPLSSSGFHQQLKANLGGCKFSDASLEDLQRRAKCLHGR